MSTIERTKRIHLDDEPPGPRRWWVAIAAAALVIAAIVGTQLIGRGSETESTTAESASTEAPTTTVATTPTTIAPAPAALTRVDTAQRIAEAYYSLDEQTLADALGDPDVAADALFRTQWDAAALNTRLAAGSGVTCADDGTFVICEARTTHDLKDAWFAMGAEPDQIRVSFAGDEVIGASIIVGSEISVRILLDWVAEHDPGRSLENCDDRTIEERAACWQAIIALIPVWVNQQDAGGTPGAAEAVLDTWVAEDLDAFVALTPDIFGARIIPIQLEQWSLLDTEVVRRDACAETGDNLVECTLVVEDDLLRALGTQRTDTFRVFSFGNASAGIIDVRWQPGEPDAVAEFLGWLDANRPDVTDACAISQGTVFDDPAGCWTARLGAVPDYLAG